MDQALGELGGYAVFQLTEVVVPDAPVHLLARRITRGRSADAARPDDRPRIGLNAAETRRTSLKRRLSATSVQAVEPYFACTSSVQGLAANLFSV
jgi:hypothetical protein